MKLPTSTKTLTLFWLGSGFLLCAQSLLAGPWSSHPPGWCLSLNPFPNPTILGGFLLATGAVMTAIGFWPNRSRPIPDVPVSDRLTCVFILIALLLAVPIRFYHLHEIPYGAHNDEIVKGMQVLKFFEGEPFQPFFVANKEFLFFYWLIPFIRFFGITIGALRALPFTCGILTVFFSWLLFHRLWGKSVAFLGAGFLAAGLWPGQSSHICERLNAVPMMTALSLYCVVIAIQSRRIWAWIAAGVTMAAGMWTFPSYRLIPAGMILFVLWSFYRRQLRFLSDGPKALLMLGIVIAGTSAPLQFNLKTTILTFFSRQGHDFKIARTPEQIITHTKQLVLSFNIDCIQDMSFTSLDSPVIWWPLGALFLTGLIVSFLHFPRPSSMFMTIWLITSLLPATISEPTVRRLTAFQPAVFGLIGLGAWIALNGLFPFLKNLKTWGLVPVTGLILITAFRNFSLFSETIGPSWCVAREDYRIVRAAVDNFDLFEIHMDWIEEEAELPYRYLTYPSTGNLDWYQPEQPQYSIPFRFNPKKDFKYLFRNIPENQFAITLLEDLYPQGVLSRHNDESYPRGFYSFTMTAEDLRSRRGVNVSVYTSNHDQPDAAEAIASFQIEQLWLNERTPLPAVPSPGAGSVWELSGIILIDKTGQQPFRLRHEGKTAFRINGRDYDPDESHENESRYYPLLAAGAHNITVLCEATGSENPIVELSWRSGERIEGGRGKAEWVPVPAERWLRPPLPEVVPEPVRTRKAPFQYALHKTHQFQHPGGGRTYDIARIEALPDGTFVANCWHYQCMVILDQEANFIREWNANLLGDPRWILRFDFDVDSNGTVYLIGETRKKMLVATSAGTLIRQIDLPDNPTAIHLDSDETALILCPRALYRMDIREGYGDAPLQVIGAYGDDMRSFKRPLAILSDSAGLVYVADRSFNRIQVYSHTGEYMKSIEVPGPLDDSFGMALDNDQNLLVPHFTQNFIACVSQDGFLLSGNYQFDSDPLDSGRVRHPRYITFSRPGEMWITNADTIYRFARVPTPFEPAPPDDTESDPTFPDGGLPDPDA